MPRLIILDCDGALTDVEREGIPFVEFMIKGLAHLTGLGIEEIRGLVEERELAVRADPKKFGHPDPQGRIVAPANADPYLRSNPIVRSVLDYCGRFKDPGDRAGLINFMFFVNYEKTDTVFRDGAREVLAALEGRNAWIVTNSDTAAVQNKMRHIGADWFVDRVIGNARKFTLMDDFDLVPEMMTLPGLDRPVYLRRKHYFDILDRLRREAGAEWEDVIVVGDIFELDLCLPLALGAEVVLVANENTPDYERAFVASHERGHVIQDLMEIPPLVGVAA